MKLKHLIIFIVLALSLASCKVTKDKVSTDSTNKSTTETKEQREVVEYETKIVKRDKDSVVWVPRLNHIYRDTTIVERGKTTTLNLDFASNGTLKKADCTADAIEELTTIQRTTNETIITLQKEIAKLRSDSKTKETTIPPILFLYAFLVLGGLIVINKVLK